MRVNIIVELRDIDLLDGWLEWRLPVLPRIGETMDCNLLARAFDSSMVFDNLAEEYQKNRRGYRDDCFTVSCSEDMGEDYLRKSLLESVCLELTRITWRYSNDFGEYPELRFKES